MRETRDIMGMPVTVEVVGGERAILDEVFAYFERVDTRFSPYKADSEVSKLNDGRLSAETYSPEMREVLALAEATKRETNGYFDVRTPRGAIDPSGLVKGWAIRKAAQLLRDKGYENFWVEAGGDIETSGVNAAGQEWSVGIRNPFNAREIVKVLYPRGAGIATSGTYIRGTHIYDPHVGQAPSPDIVSLTVIGPDVYEADRFATAAFAMGREGILFIEQTSGLEGYAIDGSGRATLTSGFARYTDANVPQSEPTPTR
jgi:thiamine biosynthesis lipoprotein